MNINKIIRVFPRRTNATPCDALTFTEAPTKNDLEQLAFIAFDEIHISVTFTYDLPKAEELYQKWSVLGIPVTIGGPAIGMRGEEFVPGQYVKDGYVITSRGCPNHCWFCSVWKREGDLRELPIMEGFNILDDNLLACSERHIRAVFAMLKRQSERPIFTGGLEAKRLQPWHVELLRSIGTKRMFFAYDTSDDLEPLMIAGRLLQDGGFSKSSHAARCYVLIGYPGDTMDAAEMRLKQAWNAGFLPFAMLYRNKNGEIDKSWSKFQRLWVRPWIVVSNLKIADTFNARQE
ncbi:hypothetical protein FACS1894187_10610 [Synergistales bacterium]|nr:hypothetical protein FACS1894187_10610 [Synergistales bacterium]